MMTRDGKMIGNKQEEKKNDKGWENDKKTTRTTTKGKEFYFLKLKKSWENNG